MKFDYNSVLHIPLSNYAFSLNKEDIVIRLRVKKNNVNKVVLYFGDTACRKSEVEFSSFLMKEILSDEFFSYFEATLKNCYQRLVYYFEIYDLNNQKHLYYADNFYKELSNNRNDLYKFPYLRKEDVANPPSWLNKTRFYNVFPDSFALNENNQNRTMEINGTTIKNKLGGTINDVIKKLDYIKNLGFNGLYINPIFLANEYHKYDVIDYFKIDPLFGNDEEFKKLVDLAHKNGMKVVIDLVLNHSGWHFFAFNDVIKNQEKSKYVSWFYDLKFPVYRPKSWEEIPPYACFGYERNMPKLNTDNDEVIKYFEDLCLYLTKEFKVDGFRLDTSDEVNDYFWICLNRVIKKEDPEVALIGEIWENPEHWLNSLIFDSAMNYELRKALLLFYQEKINIYDLKNQVARLLLRNKKQSTYSLLNILSTHDTPRFYSLVENNDIKFKNAYALLYFLPGSISVLYGEEVPIKGIKEDEYRSAIDFNKKAIFADFFRKLNELKDNFGCLNNGEISLSIVNKMLLITRYNNDKKISLLINGNVTHGIKIKENKILYSCGYKINQKRMDKFGFIIFED